MAPNARDRLSAKTCPDAEEIKTVQASRKKPCFDTIPDRPVGEKIIKMILFIVPLHVALISHSLTAILPPPKKDYATDRNSDFFIPVVTWLPVFTC